MNDEATLSGGSTEALVGAPIERSTVSDGANSHPGMGIRAASRKISQAIREAGVSVHTCGGRSFGVERRLAAWLGREDKA